MKIKTILLISFWIIFLGWTYSQKNPSKKTFSDDVFYEKSEKAIVDSIYFIFNNKDQEEAFILAQKNLNTLRSNRSLLSLNKLKAQHYKNQGVIDSSNYYIKKALVYNTSKNDSIRKINFALLSGIYGTNYRNQGLYKKAKEQYLAAIDTIKDYKSSKAYAASVFNLAYTYLDQGSLEDASYLFNQCIQDKNPLNVIISSHINLGNIYSSKKDFDKSNYHLLLAQSKMPKGKEFLFEDSILSNLGQNYLKLGQIKKGDSLIQKAIKISGENKYHLSQIEFIWEWGKTKRLLGFTKEAEKIQLLAEKKATHFKFYEMQRYIYGELEKLYLQKEDHKSAYLYLQKSNKLKDSLQNAQQNKEIKELEIKFKTAQKQKDLELLASQNSNKALKLQKQQEIIKNLELEQQIQEEQNLNTILSLENTDQKRKNQMILLEKEKESSEAKLSQEKKVRNMILISAFILLIPISFLLMLYIQKLRTQRLLNHKQKEINLQKVDMILKDQEIDLIKARVDGQNSTRKKIALELHDNLGGSLASAKLQLGKIEGSHPQLYQKLNHQLNAAYMQVRSFSQDLIHKNTEDKTFSSTLRDYIENIGNAGKIQTSFSAFPVKKVNDLSMALQTEIFRILQELVTNTLKHAQADRLEIQLFFSEEKLCLLFEDDGIGFQKDQTSAGIGLSNIEERLKNLGGSWNIDSQKNIGTIISIEIDHIEIHTHEI